MSLELFLFNEDKSLKVLILVGKVLVHLVLISVNFLEPFVLNLEPFVRYRALDNVLKPEPKIPKLEPKIPEIRA